jgi:hypothetical protein
MLCKDVNFIKVAQGDLDCNIIIVIGNNNNNSNNGLIDRHSPVGLTDCQYLLCVYGKVHLLYPIRVQDLYYAQWKGSKA